MKAESRGSYRASPVPESDRLGSRSPHETDELRHWRFDRRGVSGECKESPTRDPKVRVIVGNDRWKPTFQARAGGATFPARWTANPMQAVTIERREATARADQNAYKDPVWIRLTSNGSGNGPKTDRDTALTLACSVGRHYNRASTLNAADKEAVPRTRVVCPSPSLV